MNNIKIKFKPEKNYCTFKRLSLDNRYFVSCTFNVKYNQDIGKLNQTDLFVCVCLCTCVPKCWKLNPGPCAC